MQVWVHIDLKGLPVTPEYLSARLGDVRSVGTTHILLEWEDMLPYSGDLAMLARPNAFTAAEVASVLSAAEELGLVVVPLLQTLGHLEFVLKHERFAALREDPDDYGTLCPCSDEASSVIEALLAQVFALHPQCEQIHLGCDEPTLGSDARTAAAISAGADGLSGVLVSHVERTVRHASAFGRSCLIWHDAAMEMSQGCLSRLVATGVRFVVWDYRPQLNDASVHFARHLSLDTAASPLVATAYKGGDSAEAMAVDAAARMANQKAWSECIRGDAFTRTPVSGVVLTGWSRFGHTMPLTEMLPAAMPTLLRALGCWGDLDESKTVEAIERWRRADRTGAAVHDEVVAIAKLREQLSDLETQWRQQSSRLPPPPRLVKRVVSALAGPEGAVRARGKRLAELMGDGTLFRHDVDEWIEAKVAVATVRATRLMDQAVGLREGLSGGSGSVCVLERVGDADGGT
jgi:hexosaminidase